MVSKVLCIDVGIKNLAFCMTRKDKLEILLWKNINILDEEYNCKICGKIAKYIYEGIHYCGIHQKKKERVEIKKTSVKKINSATLVWKLLESIKFLEDIQDMEDTQVYIELQLSKNPKMKLLSHCLFTRCIQLFGKNRVSFMRASQKLKAYDKSEKTTYKDRKKLAISETVKILKAHSIDYPEFTNTTKKCDMADTFLMCYLKCNYN